MKNIIKSKIASVRECKFHFLHNAFMMLWLLVSVFTASAQNVQNPEQHFDQKNRSNFKIDPATGALSIEITLGTYAGRGGTSLPIILNYSSKVWQMDYETVIDNPLCDYGPNFCTLDPMTIISARYGVDSASGWTTNLSLPHFIDNDSSAYDYRGRSCVAGPCLQNTKHIDRFFLKMPDGSTHEMRKNDGVHAGSYAASSGVYYSVDGSRLRYDFGNNTLYLPDGSRYVGYKYIDRSGNIINYGNANSTITDSLGRSIPFPSLSTIEGDFSYSLPGIGNTTLNYTLKWKKLENALTDSSQPLHYTGDRDWTTNSIFSPALFEADEENRFYISLHNPVVLSEIVLPNNQSYKFTYNIYGEIDKVVYPTGAYERFVHMQVRSSQFLSFPYDQANRGIVEQWISPTGNSSDEQLWEHYPGPQSTIIQPDGVIVKNYFHKGRDFQSPDRIFGFDDSRAGKPIEERIFAPGNTLKSRNLSRWEQLNAMTFGSVTGHQAATRDPYLSKHISIIFENGSTEALMQMTEYEYDSNPDPAYFARLNVKLTKSYDYVVVPKSTAETADFATLENYFAGQSPLSVQENDYLYNTNYKARNITGLLIETRIKDGAGNVKAKTQIAYDEADYVESANILNAPNWENSNISYRGLPTTIRNWTDIENNLFVETHTSYDQFGNPKKRWDGKGNFTEIQYADNYTDGISRNTYALPTKTISYSGANGSGTVFETSVKYDFDTSLPRYSKDVNNQTSEIQYDDALLRPTKTIAPNGQQTITEYGAPDSSGQFSAAQRFIKVRTQVDEQKWKEVCSWFDGLGRTVKIQTIDAQGDIYVETEYDNMGRIKKTSNPYRMGETIYKTENYYDISGRIIKVKLPDNSEVLTGYGLATSGESIGTTLTVTDQAGKQRRSVSNALAQLIRVDEPDRSGDLGNVYNPVQPTFYKYNTLGKMIEVTQGVQQRHFLYDSAGRLLRVRQPEQQVNPALNLSNPELSNTQWTGGFSYDANGNLLTTTDAKDVTTTISYDALNRIKTKSYSDTVTPTVNFTYDDPNVPFSTGRLTKISSTISETRYKIYDAMGRLASSEQATDGQIFPTNYKYNLAGILTEETYPSGRTIKNFLEADGDLSSISSKTANGQFKTYASNFAYTASGVIKLLQIGNGLWESAKMNNRNQVTELRLGNSPSDASLWKLNYDYGVMDATGTVDVTKNSGNIARQTINFSGLNQPFVQTYNYDSLDRITEAKETNGSMQTWIQNFAYDRYGNRTQFSQNILGQQIASNDQTLPTIDAHTNKFEAEQGYDYDANGNLIQDYSGRQFTFDGDNKQTLVKDTSNNIIGRYFYDGNGKRVKKMTNSETTIFVYDGTGKLVAEYSTAMPVRNPTVNYTATDPLGSPRVLTNSRKEIVSRRDFMPFGEELSPDLIYRTADLKYGAGDNIRQKFTGYQRDEETNLDFAEARYYNNSHGRFTAVDPLLASGKSANPQTFNRYAYTMNRPLILTDPNGLQAGQKSEMQQGLIPLPDVLLNIAKLETRTSSTGMVFRLTPEEIRQRIDLATLAYNEGFKQGERNAQEKLGQTIEVNSVESVDSSSREKSNESSSETGISVSPKDVGVSQKQTDKIGVKNTNNESYKVGGTVKSGISETVAGTKDLSKARQTVINEQSSKVRDVIDTNDQPTRLKIDVAPSVNDLIEKSTLLGKGDGYDSYVRSNLIKQE